MLSVAVVALFVSVSGFAQGTDAKIPGDKNELTTPRGNQTAADERQMVLGEENADKTAAPQTNTQSAWPYLLRILIVMTLVVLVIYGVFRLLKSFSKAKTPEDPYIKLLASTQIATGRWLHVVSLGSKAYFIGAAESGISLIAEVNDKELIDTLNLRAANAPQAPVNDFASIVQALLRPKDRRVRIADENPQADFIKRQRERLDKF